MQEDLAVLLGKRFIERRDVKAVQYPNGHYEPDVVHAGHPGKPCPGTCPRVPWRMDDLHAHLDGSRTFGHYLVSPEGNCKLFAFDIDLTKDGWYTPVENNEVIACNPREAWLTKGHPAREHLLIALRTRAEALAGRTKELIGCPVAVAYSGSKGFHVYGFTDSMPAADARAMALLVIESFGDYTAFRGENFFRDDHAGPWNVELEVFPKQDSIGAEGFGNLMRLALGVHKKTGHRGMFIDLQTPHNVFREADPSDVLANGQTW